ncbi:hypothetical protein V6N13_148434 [Hibiscus sabdariffa]
MFLFTIEDEELYLMLEDVNWSYLNENFQEVVPWSEKINYSERATWLEIRGLSLHCWNCVKLKKIAGLWGSFEALGENHKHTMDCEKVRVLVATNRVRQIEEIIDVEIGDGVFQVSVKEVGFNDGTSYPLCNNRNSELVESEKTYESTKNSKSDTVKSKTEEEVDRSRSGKEEEEVQAIGGELKDTVALDGLGSGEGDHRGVEEPIESIEGIVAAHDVSDHGKLCGNLDNGSDKGCCPSFSGAVYNGVEGVAENNSVVKLSSIKHAGGDVFGQKKSWADMIIKNVHLGHFDSRYSIEEDNMEDDLGRGFLTYLEGNKGK